MHCRRGSLTPNCKPSRTAPIIGAALGVLSVLAMYAAAERAHAAPAAAGFPASGAAGADESLLRGTSNETDAPDSREQGQTQLSDSFDRRPIATLLSESRFVGLRDTTFSVQ